MESNTENQFSEILAVTELKPKNLLNDGLEEYLLKMAIEAESIPLICKGAAWVYLTLEFWNTDRSSTSYRKTRLTYANIWGDILQCKTDSAKQQLLSEQKGAEILREMARIELSDPMARLRIFILLGLIALIVFGVLWLALR